VSSCGSAAAERRAVLRFGWRIPFLASAALVGVGLYVRLKLSETPAFLRTLQHNERVRVPLLMVLHGTGASSSRHVRLVSTFVLFYLMTVFALSWATTAWVMRARIFSNCR
jgi:MFS family permease